MIRSSKIRFRYHSTNPSLLSNSYKAGRNFETNLLPLWPDRRWDRKILHIYGHGSTWCNNNARKHIISTSKSRVNNDDTRHNIIKMCQLAIWIMKQYHLSTCRRSTSCVPCDLVKACAYRWNFTKHSSPRPIWPKRLGTIYFFIYIYSFAISTLRYYKVMQKNFEPFNALFLKTGKHAELPKPCCVTWQNF